MYREPNLPQSWNCVPCIQGRGEFLLSRALRVPILPLACEGRPTIAEHPTQFSGFKADDTLHYFVRTEHILLHYSVCPMAKSVFCLRVCH